MTLSFFSKSNKPDNRMAEYGQAVIRLGEERAGLIREIEIKRKELGHLIVSKSLIFDEIRKQRDKLDQTQRGVVDEKSSILFDYEKKIEQEQKKLDDILIRQSSIDKQIEEAKKSLINLGGSVSDLVKQRERLVGELNGLNDSLIVNRQARDQEMSSLRDLEKRKERLISEIQDISSRGMSVDKELSEKRKELEDLNDVVSVLRSSNKEGLDLVASFEGERKRLREKEDFLDRKEADLLVYENRLKKRMREAGIEIDMIFK